jgi:hypothetical protein
MKSDNKTDTFLAIVLTIIGCVVIFFIAKALFLFILDYWKWIALLVFLIVIAGLVIILRDSQQQDKRSEH